MPPSPARRETVTPCPLCGHDAATLVAPLVTSRLVRCRACRLAYRNPLRQPDDIRAEYDAIYRETAATARLDERRRRIFAEFLTRVRSTAGGTVLDVGCGTGHFLELARAMGWRTVGVELSPRGAAVARSRGHTVYESSSAVPAGSVNAVTLWNVLDYFDAPLRPLRDAHRALVPGGVVFIRTPNEAFQLTAYRLSRLVRWPRVLAGLLAETFHFHSLLWSPRTLQTALERAGFVGAAVWNSVPSAGDPYHDRPRIVEAAFDVAKRSVYSAARTASLLTGGRLAIGTSIVAMARKPDAPVRD